MVIQIFCSHSHSHLNIPSFLSYVSGNPADWERWECPVCGRELSQRDKEKLQRLFNKALEENGGEDVGWIVGIIYI